jgi:hypothetical protein
VSPVDYARARRLLLRRDPIIAGLIRAHGACGLADGVHVDYFAALARSIIFSNSLRRRLQRFTAGWLVSCLTAR